MEPVNCKIVSWEEIDDWTNMVASKIKDEGYDPDTCIGMTRGGWIPSRLICDRLGIKDLHAVKTEHWGITATKDGKAKLAAPLPIMVEDRKILIVDDITDTGQSLNLALDHVRSKGAEDVMSATLLHITHSVVTPDFYAVEVKAREWAWFIFPWNFNEDITSLVTKALGDGEKESMDIKDELMKQCRIAVDQKVIDRTLSELAKVQAVVKKGEMWQKKE